LARSGAYRIAIECPVLGLWLPRQPVTAKVGIDPIANIRRAIASTVEGRLAPAVIQRIMKFIEMWIGPACDE
jgi:hypothetical protein